MSDRDPPDKPGPPLPDDLVKRLGSMFVSAEKQGEEAASNVVPIGKGKRAKDGAVRPVKPPKPPRSPRAFRRLPDDCPVVPLGVYGRNYFFLDCLKQLQIVPAKEMGTQAINSLFGEPEAQEWLDRVYPRLGEGGTMTGIDRDLLTRSLLAGCGERSRGGVFDPSGRIRGDGGWCDEARRLVFHSGDVILTADATGRLHEGQPGVRDSMIYPMGVRQLRPADHAKEGTGGPGMEMLEMVKRWNWKRGELDAMLQLGWLTMAPVAGALRWRPALWITGDLSTGKSTLQELIYLSQGGDAGILTAAATTGAGIWQSLRFRSVPVAVDELEASPNNERKAGILELMRISASGGRIRRGTVDHSGTQFNVYASFLFSSINMLPLEPQDASRLAILELDALPRGAVRPVLEGVHLARLGAGLRRRVVNAWPRWEEHLAPWWEAINAEFGQRLADTYGILFAMAYLAMWDEPAHRDAVDDVLNLLAPSLREWKAVAGSDHERMLNHLSTWTVEPFEHGKFTLRQLAYWASNRPPMLQASTEMYGDPLQQAAAGRALRMHGLAVIRSRKPEDRGIEYFAIANRHAQLTRIFRGTKWSDNGWRQTAGRVPGARTQNVRFEGPPELAAAVPLAALLGSEMEEDGDAGVG